MLRYRLKCVKSYTFVTHKGYYSAHSQTLRRAWADFEPNDFGQKPAAGRRLRQTTVDACHHQLAGRIGGDTPSEKRALSQCGRLVSFMYTQPVSTKDL